MRGLCFLLCSLEEKASIVVAQIGCTVFWTRIMVSLPISQQVLTMYIKVTFHLLFTYTHNSTCSHSSQAGLTTRTSPGQCPGFPVPITITSMSDNSASESRYRLELCKRRHLISQIQWTPSQQASANLSSTPPHSPPRSAALPIHLHTN